MDSLRKKLETARMNPESTAEVQKLNAELQLAVERLERLKGEAQQTQQQIDAAGGSSSKTGRSLGKWGSVLKGSAGILDKINSRVNRILSGVHKTSKGIDRCTQSADRFSRSLRQMVNLLKFSLFSMTFSTMFTGLASGFESIARYSSSANRTISELQSAFLQLRNAVAAAAIPFLDLLAPALIQIVSLAVSAVNAVGQLFAALTGKGTVLKATGAYKDYAASLNKAGAAAKNAALGIDELNVIEKESAGGAGAGGLDPDDMFEEVEVEGKLQRPCRKDQKAFKRIFCTAERGMEPGRQVCHGFLEVCAGRGAEACKRHRTGLPDYVESGRDDRDACGYSAYHRRYWPGDRSSGRESEAGVE